MKKIKYILIAFLIFSLAIPALAGNGPGGPGGGGRPQASPTPGGGGGDIPDTGDLYGDLYVILRDEYGIPILDSFGCIQPISTVTASTTILTSSGVLTINVIEGEPFSLPTYTDPAGDLVECELTEDMATWVEGVDFGRLNLGRAPDGVIAHAFDEAVKKMNTATNIQLDPAGRLVLTLPDATDPTLLVDKTIDAPAENLALYMEMMKYGDWILENTDPITQGGPPDGKGPSEGDGPSSVPRPVLNANAITLLNAIGFTNLGVSDTSPILNNAEINLAASLLAAAADKTGEITLDMVVYINSIYGINQLGSLTNPITGVKYYDFGGFNYDRNTLFSNRKSGICDMGWIYVLQPEAGTDPTIEPLHFVTTCMEILGYEAAHDPLINSVRFTDMVEVYTTANVNGIPIYGYDFIDNVRAFTQASDDALQVIEYIHNYKVPEVLYE